MLKNALFLAGASEAQMREICPALRCELPNDWFFEVTGVLQVVPAAVTAFYLRRLVRRRSRVLRATRASGNQRGDTV